MNRWIALFLVCGALLGCDNDSDSDGAPSLQRNSENLRLMDAFFTEYNANAAAVRFFTGAASAADLGSGSPYRELTFRCEVRNLKDLFESEIRQNNSAVTVNNKRFPVFSGERCPYEAHVTVNLRARVDRRREAFEINMSFSRDARPKSGAARSLENLLNVVGLESLVEQGSMSFSGSERGGARLNFSSRSQTRGKMGKVFDSSLRAQLTVGGRQGGGALDYTEDVTITPAYTSGAPTRSRLVMRASLTSNDSSEETAEITWNGIRLTNEEKMKYNLDLSKLNATVPGL